jgi:integrase/recombinase XerD
MLIDHVERYLALRRTLGFKLRNVSGNLRAFARFAAERGDTHVGSRQRFAGKWAISGQGVS